MPREDEPTATPPAEGEGAGAATGDGARTGPPPRDREADGAAIAPPAGAGALAGHVDADVESGGALRLSALERAAAAGFPGPSSVTALLEARRSAADAMATRHGALGNFLSAVDGNTSALRAATDPLGSLRGVLDLDVIPSALRRIAGLSGYARQVAEGIGRLGDVPGIGAGIHATPGLAGVPDHLRSGFPGTLIGRGAGMEAALSAVGLSNGQIGALSRSAIWAEALSTRPPGDVARLLGAGASVRDQLDRLHVAAGGLLDDVGRLRAEGLLEFSGPGRSLAGVLGATSLKLSVFAGATDLFGPGAAGSASAFASLMGTYRSHSGLEPLFWRDTAERARVYRDAEVDEGLVEAGNEATLEVLIGSGALEGGRSRGGRAVAVVDVGPVRMTIGSTRTRFGAYRVIDGFETRLRSFIAAKLQAEHGPDWFKHRVPGEVGKKAKNRRREAMRGGETKAPLIDFVDLGDLIHILNRNDNWEGSFRAVFQRREELAVDLERLNVIRRPVMHARKVDGVQLCETVLTVRRLMAWMEKDGSWDEGWDDDD